MSDNKKLLTFLGPNDYKIYRYTYKGETFDTEFFAQALAEWNKPIKTFVFLTPEARAHKNWDMLKDRIRGIVGVDIPSGKNEKDIWEIFSKITETLDERDRVIFDITHGFRSIPILALLSTSFLRTAKNVTFEAIVYGASEAKDKEPGTGNEIVPVFNLTPFEKLLDWITATNEFIRYGEGNELAGLLQAYSEDESVEKLTKGIKNISDGLRLLRPLDVVERAAELPQHFMATNEIISHKIPPFRLLAKSVEESYSKFGVPSPNPRRNAKEILVRNLSIIEWYIEKGQIVQCLSLAREWVLSLLCMHYGLDPMVYKKREAMGDLLRGDMRKERVLPYLSQWSSIPDKDHLSTLWKKLTKFRNDVVHSGFSKDAKTPDEIKEQTVQFVVDLKEIARLWNLPL